MANLGRNLAHRSIGIGKRIDPASVPVDIKVSYDNFRNGLWLADRPADVAAGNYSLAQDVETSRKDTIVRSPGITVSSGLVYPPNWWFVHPSLEAESALVAISPPYVGVKEDGDFVWTDAGLDTDGDQWVAAIYGDVLLLNNGVRGYARDFNTGVISSVPQMPGAATLFVAFGRVFAGGVSLLGEFNPQAVAISGLEGDYSDWEGTGSSSELLLIDAAQGDWVVAGRNLSYNLVALLNRRSLWIGTRTGAVTPAATFEPRIIGIGCVAEPTAKTTEAGVTFLSDEGVCHFDGQLAPIISGAVNAELLPIDFTQIDRYKALWDASRRRYYLTTPVATFIYQFPTSEYPRGAWFKRTIAPLNLIAFSQQGSNKSWADAEDYSWDEVTGTWRDQIHTETNATPDVYFATESQYGKADTASSTNFGVPLNPYFQPRLEQQPPIDTADRVLITREFITEYKGSGTLQFLEVSESGEVTQVALQVLPVSDRKRIITTGVMDSGRAEGIIVRIVSGSPEISSIKQSLIDNGPILTDLSIEHLYDEASTYPFTEADTGGVMWE